MKIALIGSAPSSIGLAPYSDPAWEIWGCSPGAYPLVPRSNAWFEIHRWEPPVIGNPNKQVPWLTPEYTAWLYKHPQVWMFDPPADMPNGHRIPHEPLRKKYSDFFFTSSLAWMFAMALERVLHADQTGDKGPHKIGLWGVDMAAFEEYGYQRAGCQIFAMFAKWMGVEVVVPPESDLLTPAPLYGLWETTHKGIKLTSRLRELTNRKNQADARLKSAEQEAHFLGGALDDMKYHNNNWMFDGEPSFGDFDAIFGKNGPGSSDTGSQEPNS